MCRTSLASSRNGAGQSGGVRQAHIIVRGESSGDPCGEILASWGMTAVGLCAP